MTALSERQRDGSRAAPAGSGPSTWQLVLWRFLALVRHVMRPSAPDERSNMVLNRYLRRYPLRAAAYGVFAWTAALLVIVPVMLAATVLLGSLHLRPRGGADFGVTLLHRRSSVLVTHRRLGVS